MADAALWGQVTTLIDNAEARLEAGEDSAYEMPLDSGYAKPRGQKAGMPSDQEPIMVWVMVVGSIAALFVLGKLFKSAKA